ncbi:LicD family protein [Paraeggerthella sp. LCP19S3_G8]|uniref:LicD family protein n=1 Tax=Paraeggerthella sp. LCP19S3_G8 TaxID=3440248 RepID=UPI003F965C15
MITADEMTLVKDQLGYLDAKRCYEAFVKAAELASRKNEAAKLLADFDTFCSEADVKYFLFADSLKGADVYEDFIPGESKIQIGILNSQLDRLQTYAEQPVGKNALLKKDMNLSFYGNDSSARRRFPLVERISTVEVRFNDENVFNRDSFPIEFKPCFELSIFSAMPDDFLVKRGFVRAMRRRNLLLDRVRRAKKEVRESKRKFFGSNALFMLFSEKMIIDALFRCSMRYEGPGSSCVSRMFGSRTKQVSLEALGEYRRVSFHGVEAWAPEMPTSWDVEPLEEPTPELRHLQNKALQVVSEIHRVCKVLGIGYFVCGGTMLGYVRHGGFIPWDDDIDVGMLREDYDLFLKEAPAILDRDRFFLQTRGSDPSIPYLFSKVRMNGTLYVTEYNKDRDFHKGICVDVFPFDAVPNEVSRQKAMRQKARLLERRHNRIANHQYTREMLKRDESLPRSWHSVLARFVGLLATKWYQRTPLSKTQSEFEACVRQYNDACSQEDLRYVACFIPSFTMVRRDDLLPYKEVSFEHTQVNVPSNPHIFLRMQYGDYAELPLRHQCVGHSLLEFGEDEVD